MKIIDILIDLISGISVIRKRIRYASNRLEGLQYKSYGLSDEVALALSFVNRSNGGVIDAGANKGDWSKSYLAAKPIFEKLVVIEPQSIHTPSLREFCVNDARIVIEQVAIGAVSGSLTLFSDSVGSSLASLYERDLNHVGAVMSKKEVVSVTTLDSLARKHGLDRVAYLKLDLEGHELEALKGAKELLDSKSIDALSFEFGGCNIDSRTYVKDFWSLLVYEYGFTFYRLLPKRRLKRMPKYTESIEQFSWQNILACAPGVTPDWKILD